MYELNEPGIVTLTPLNIDRYGIFCLKTPKHPGYLKKRDWYLRQYKNGHRINIQLDEQGQSVGFIEFMPGEYAWRPVNAHNYLFIQCLWIRSKRKQGYAETLINSCMEAAIDARKYGVCVMTSDGSWLAGPGIYQKAGFEHVEQRDRFKLFTRRFSDNAPPPRIFNWNAVLPEFQGWHLVYADQCPMHEKSAFDLADVARNEGFKLQITRLTHAEDAQKGPSGYGVYGLIHNGRLLQDHYVSKTRFRNILKTEVNRAT